MCTNCNGIFPRWHDNTYGPILPVPPFLPVTPQLPDPSELGELLKVMTQPQPNTQYSEVEHKFAADHVQVADFIEWAKTNLVGAKHLRVQGQDDYYQQG